jgi:AbrB family looped-hinge helix DNA binding protein
MGDTIRMDRFGRIVIPHAVRERYGMGSGSHQFEIIESAEGIVLRPSVTEIPAERHPSGWVVFQSGGDVDPVRAVDEERERRLRGVRGDG